MAAAVVSVVVEDILMSLGEGMKIGQQLGIEHELREIHDLLSSIRGVWPEAENKYGRSFELQEWVLKLKDASFDAEELLEELHVEEALWQRKRKVCRLFRSVDRLTYRWRMRDELRAVVRRLKDLIRSDWVGLLRNVPSEIGEADEEARTVPFIGRDDEKGKLMRHLLYGGKERGLPFLIVYGSRGIGKTALVQEVLSESELSRHYNIIIWVNASPPFDENRMARDIIASLTKGGVTEEENVVVEQLLVRVRKLLDGRKKYLFILDDLSVQDSERQRWLRFWSFLEGGATGSKILVTTRHHEQVSCEDDCTLHLGRLNMEGSIDLLLRTAFKGGVKEIIDPVKCEIAKKVASEFDGNPLIIRAVGNYLSLQHSRRDWSCFRNRVNDFALSTLLCGGYPYGHLGPMVKRYNHLTPRIKRCFGICSLFPRGHVIDRQTLSELWIALGYIKPSNEDHQPLEVIADDYFNQLLTEELLKVKKFDTFGKESSVVLHPDAENLARSVSEWECLPNNWRNSWWEEVKKPRHASIINCRLFRSYLYDLTGVQTVLHFVDDTNLSEALWNFIIPDLKNTRVLDLHSMNVETVHEGVWKLKLLRYLDLSDNRRIETLPSEITGLLNLQTLKLSGCSALKELPQDMRKMVALRHLYIDGCRKLSFMPKGLGDLKFLSILTDFILPPDDSSSVDSANLAELYKLNDLRGSLRITNLDYSEAAREIQGLLDKKSSLESLELIFRNLPTDTVGFHILNDTLLLDELRPHPKLKGLKIHNYEGFVLPEWMNELSNHLPNLVELALIGCRYLNDNYFPQFGQLRHLKSLTIQGLPDLRMESGPELSSPDVANNAQIFGELSSLCIRDCPKLECLPKIPRLVKLTLVNVSEQLFGHPFYASCLKTLRIENIELLHHLPEEWLQDLTSLEELHIRSCPKLNGLSTTIPSLVKMTLANLSEELFWKPCHLPSLKTLRLKNIEPLHHLPGHWLRYLTSLKELHIGSCPSLVSLSRGIMRLKNLVSLSIWNCKELDLSKDEHGNVMMELQVPKSLKFVTINKASKMKNLPEWLSRVYTLRFLCINSCPNLVALPEWIGNLRSLELLELVHCPLLKSLPAGMHEFINEYPRKLSIVGCPDLQAKEIKHSRSL